MSRERRSVIANDIRRYRRKRNLRLRDVALLTGHANLNHISDWEKGRRAPSLLNALKLSAAIACPVEVLFSELFSRIRQNMYAHQKNVSPFREYLSSNKNKNENS